MQVGVNSQLNFVFFIPYVSIIVSLIFTQVPTSPDMEVRLYLFGG